MARHNREARGCDQQGFDYTISYQPDWLRQVKVTRVLDSGRQSTRTLFCNPDDPERKPGRQVRTQIRSEEQGLGFEIALTDPDRVVRRIIVETGARPANDDQLDKGDIHFTIDHRV